MTKSITVKIVNVYGNERIYPVCDIAHSFSFIANTKTLSRADIKHIKDIGFEIVVEGPTLQESKMTYNYIVWVGGVDDYYTDLNQAIQHFEEWIEKGYEDVILQEIKTNKILRRAR